MKYSHLLVTALVAAATQAYAQVVPENSESAPVQAAVPNPGPAASPDGQDGSSREPRPLDRWLQVNDLSFSFRYRSQFSSLDYRLFDNGQEKSLINARLKFDPEGKYSINMHVSSGRTFNWAYASQISYDYHYHSIDPGAFAVMTPTIVRAVIAAFTTDTVGNAQAFTTHSRGWRMGFRQLYFRAAPIEQMALEYGSLYIEKGLSTEATTYDDDGYIAGERIQIFDPKHLFVDKLAFTNAYLGDLETPNFFDRGQRLGEANYRQVLATKRFGKRFEASTDYTFDKGLHTIREAALTKIPEARVFDTVRLELYQRVNSHELQGQIFDKGAGFAATASKLFRKKFQLDGGFAHIDDNYGVLTGSRLFAVVGFSMNGDAFLTGDRAFTRANWKIAPGLTLFGYYTHGTSPGPVDRIQLSKQGVNGGLTLDFKALLSKAGIL